MEEQRGYPKEFVPITIRLRDAFLKAIENEIPAAKKQGMPEKMFFEGVMNTLLNATIRFACRGYFNYQPGAENKEGEERVRRMQQSLSEALKLVLSHEREELKPDALWQGKHQGHA
jgi:hypothetical protein